MVAAQRQERPLLPDGPCPFCPGSGKVPEDYDVLAYENDFPSLVPDPPEADLPGDDLIPVRPSLGKCEVTLYSPRHDVTLPELPLDHLVKLVKHWRERYRELGSLPGIEYVFVFENRGEAVGVTIHHPHGQIYAYPFIPQRLQVELASFLDHWSERRGCLLCDLLEHELEGGTRVVHREMGFMAFVPPFAQYGYDIFIAPERHLGSLAEMDEGEMRGLALALRRVVGGYDALFGIPFPYMMCMHQNPTDGKEYPHYHFHVEFYPPLRDRDKLKFSASSETGAWAHINTTVPEEKAAELREAIGRFLRGSEATG
ncbi:MAG: galactose-1-phosphate uridylyltransferase [Actinobacteria bacterium]|nr:galactose-1-phosphate uridylyltransferase [Actinomycetota bacterium]